MCGIVGWVGPQGQAASLDAMMRSIVHRGPDGSGATSLELSNERYATFGHVRLAIVDAAAGAQPMSIEDGRLTLSYNGEIYNYIELREELSALGAVFKTRSDTEVLLTAWQQWGEACLSRLRGMFAFSLHDAETDTVYLARDSYGKKPLFYYQTDDSLIFGSEIGALLAHPKVDCVLDEASVYEYLSWRYVPGPNTFFEGIKKVVPGTLMRWHDNAITTCRFYEHPASIKSDGCVKNAVSEFTEIFDEAVKIRMRSDVPVGMFLSSGIDSAAVLESVSRSGNDVKAFSVGYSDGQMSELDAAGELASHFDVPFEPILLEPSGLMSYISDMTFARGAPISEAADVPVYVMSKRAAEDVKVVLTGEGADEFFAGYPKHLIEARLGGLGPVMKLTGEIAGRLGNRRLKIAGKAMRTRKYEDRMIQWFGAMSEAERKAVWTGRNVTRPTDVLPFETAKGASALRKALHFDQTSWLPDNVLERGDRMTMAASIELRAPFMDTELAAFAATLPDDWLLKGRVTKRILRAAMADKLPSDVLTRKKKGFPVPISHWFRHDLKEELQGMLCSKNSMISDFVDPDWIQQMVNAHLEGDLSKDKLLWMLFTLELFLQSFFGKNAAKGLRH